MRLTVVVLVTVSWGCSGRVMVASQPAWASGQLVPGAVTVAVLGSAPVGSRSVAGNGSAARVSACTITVAPGPTSPTAQVTVTPSADAQPSTDDTNVSPAGRWSVTTTPCAAAGVALTIENAKGTTAPGMICGAGVNLVMVSCGWSGTSAVAEQSGSVPPAGQFEPGEPTEAVLGTVPSGVTIVAGNGSAATATTRTVTEALAARSPSAHVITTPSADVQPSGDETKVSPSGSVSVTTTAGAPTGVPLVTVRS